MAFDSIDSINWNKKDEVINLLTLSKHLFQHAPAHIKNKQWAALAAIKNSESNLTFVSNRLLNNPNFIKKLLKTNLCFLPLISDEFSTNVNFCKYLIKEIHPIFIAYSDKSMFECRNFKQFCFRQTVNYMNNYYKECNAIQFLNTYNYHKKPHWTDELIYKHISSLKILSREHDSIFDERFASIFTETDNIAWAISMPAFQKFYNLINLDIWELAIIKNSKDSLVSILPPRIKAVTQCDYHKYDLIHLIYTGFVDEWARECPNDCFKPAHE